MELLLNGRCFYFVLFFFQRLERNNAQDADDRCVIVLALFARSRWLVGVEAPLIMWLHYLNAGTPAWLTLTASHIRGFFFLFFSFLSFFLSHDQKMGVMMGAEVHSVDSHIVRKIPLFHLLPTHTHTHTTGRAQWTSACPSLISPFSFSPLSWRKRKGSALRCYYYLHFSSHPAEQQCLTIYCKNRILHPPAKPCGFSSQIKMDVFFPLTTFKIGRGLQFYEGDQCWPALTSKKWLQLFQTG